MAIQADVCRRPPGSGLHSERRKKMGHPGQSALSRLLCSLSRSELPIAKSSYLAIETITTTTQPLPGIICETLSH